MNWSWQDDAGWAGESSLLLPIACRRAQVVIAERASLAAGEPRR